MHSDLIGKIEKARQYAQEPDRIQIERLQIRFQGDNRDHIITLDEDGWHCTCSFFKTWGTCQHVMAMQKIFDQMLSDDARQPELAISMTNGSTAHR